jgi:hypothetical protein
MTEILKQHFRDKRSNEQTVIKEGEKYFKPVIKAQKEVSKEIIDSLNKNQESLTKELVPFNRNLERRIDQVEELHSSPYYNEPLEELEGFSQSTPKKEDFTKDVDLDYGLNDTDIENLDLLKLEKPSIVFKNGTHLEVLKNLAGQQISLGKIVSDKDKTGKKSSARDKEIAKSQQITLKKYRSKLNLIKKAHEEKVFGEGLKINNLNNDDLIKILYEIKDKGNSKIGLTILDELLKRHVIDNKKYDEFVTNYFSKRQKGRPRKAKERKN